MALKLYANKDNQRIKKILITAKYVDATVEIPPFEVGKDNKTEDFLRKNPIGKIPVLETAEGFLFESNAICKYLASTKPAAGLLGQTPLETAQVDQWLDFCTNEIEPSVMAWIGPILGYIPYNADIHNQAVANLKTTFGALERYLERNTFLVGERLTLADIICAATLVPLYSRVWEPRLRSPFAAVNRWFETICMQEKFSAVLKLEVANWCTVAQKAKAAAAPAPAAKPEEKPKAEAKPKEEKPKEEKPKAEKPKEEKPKAEKPKKEAKPKDDDDDDGDDDDTPKEVKPKSTMDLLPKSTFILDAFKREYSNNKKIEPTMEFLWANFDPEGYSMWWAEYKYQDENTVSFKTTNLIGGFYQRMERMHKYAFGQMLMCGEESRHDLFGFWIIRGQEIPDIMLDVPDVDLYEWTKISWPVDDDTKKKIQEVLNWGNVRGECIDGKTFK